MHAVEIQRVHAIALHLVQEIQNIEFAMTLEEQQGLYSLIRCLDFETWDDPNRMDQEDFDHWMQARLMFGSDDRPPPNNRPQPTAEVQSARLKQLLEKIKSDPDETGKKQPDILKMIRARAGKNERGGK
jgi:hypothetical protein